MIAIGYVHPGWVTHQFVETLLAAYRGLAEAGETAIRIAAHSGPNVAEARNDVARRCIDAGADLLFIDTDIYAPGSETVVKLLGVGGAITGADYLGRHPTDGSTFRTAHVEGPNGYYRISEGSIVADPMEVAGVGMGYTLIRHRVLKDLMGGGNYKRPSWPFGESIERFGNDTVGVSEDLTFCRRAAKAGHTTWFAPGIRVGHVKEAVL